MNEAAIKIITGATLILPDGSAGEGCLLVEGNRIRSISAEPPAALLLNRENVEVISGTGCYLTPGLIELHFNGAFGCNLNRTTIGEVRRMLEKLPSRGVTSAVFTVITASLTDMLSAIHTLEEVIHHRTPTQCRPLGLHMEGPFINPAFRGTHPSGDVRAMNLDELTLLLSPMMKMVTFAPELDPSGDAIALMRERSIRASIGHSGATAAQAIQAIRQGASCITHLFNAMRPFHHREPGAIGPALGEEHFYVQFIGDGAHVHPEAIRMILRAKRPEYILLTSDASPIACMGEGAQGSFAAQNVFMKGGRVFNQEGGLAGSGRTVDDCLRNLIRWELCDFSDGIRYAARNPADFLGETDLGRLEPGYLADLVLWNRQTLDVETTLINGNVVYRKSIPVTEAPQIL